MTRIDLALLNVTERLCRRFQRLTGRTNVWLAFQLTNLSIVVYFFWGAMYIWRAEGTEQWVVGLFFAALFYGLTQTIFRVPVDAYETSAYERVAKGIRNPRRLRDVPLRLPFLTLSVVLIYPFLFAYLTLRLPIILVSYSLIVLTTIVLYLLACDPLPPCPGQVAEWLRGLRPWRAAPSEAPTRE